MFGRGGSVGKPKYEHGKHVRDMDRTRRLSVASTGGPPTEPNVNLPHSVAEILTDHVTFQLESIDRMYLNVYIPELQYEGGVVKFFHGHRGQPIASSVLMSPMTKSFVQATERFAEEYEVPLIEFEKGQRKDDVMAERLRHFDQPDGVVFIGKAQEKASVFRTEKRRNPQTGQRYPWIVRSSAMVNHYYWYCLDRDFGPSSSSSAPISPTPPSFVSTAMSMPNANSSRRGSLIRRWIMVSPPAPTRNACRRFANNSARSKLTNCYVAGSPACPIPLRHRTGPPGTAMMSPSSKPSSP